MTVAHILATKGRDIVSIKPTSKISEAAAILGQRRIGVVIVLQDGGQLAGILSERDVVRAIGLHGAAVLDDPVSRHMTERVITCSETDTALHVLSVMTAGRFRHIPVISEGRLSGLISIGDVVKRRLSDMENQQKEMINYISQTAD
jgi:CBS domain-containing protein